MQLRIIPATIVLLLIIAATSGRAQDCSQNLTAAHELFDRGEYDAALASFQELTTSPHCDNNSRGEAHFYAGYCLYHLGQDSAAVSEIRQSIVLRPKLRLAEDVYPERIYELYAQARSELLCTIEIEVGTPGAVAMLDGDRIILTYVRRDIPAGTMVRLEQSKYAPYVQPHMLMPGQVNRYRLELKPIIGTDFLSLRYVGEDAEPIQRGVIVEGDSGPYLEAGGHRVDFRREYYEDSLLTYLTIGEDSAAIRLAVIESRDDWHDLQHHLEKNPGVRKWFGRFKIISAVGLLAAGGLSTHFHSKASDDYDQYLNALPDETYRTYRDYEHHIALRNIFGAAALTLVASELIWFVANPKDEATLIDEFKARHTSHTSLAIDYRPDYFGLKLAYSF